MSEFIKNISDRQTKLSLRTILIIPFVLQIFAVVSLTGYLSFKNGQQAVNSITTQLLREISLRVEQNLENFLAMPHKINQQNTNYIKLKQLDVQDFSKLEKHFYEQLKVFDTVSLIGFATKNQELISSERFPDGSLTIRVSNKSTNYNLRTYTTDSQGKRTGINDYGKPYDPRRRYWYNQPIKTGRQVWSEIYPHNSGIALYVAASQPVYDNQGNLQGVLLSNLNLSKIGTFLNSLNIGKTGISFIIERPSGTLVATSTDEKPFRTNYVKTQLAENKIKSFLATESSDIKTRLTAKYLKAKFSNFSAIKFPQQLDFKIDSKRQFIQVLPFQERRGIDWLIVVVVPEEDFMSEINANTRTTIILCIVALIIAITVGLLIVNSINKAVIILKESALALAQGEWEKRIEIKRTDELGELARAFNSMADQLADYNSILEQQVAKRTLELQQEIAERKQAEQALVESETRFRLLAEATFEAIVITQKGVILDANQTCAEMFGYELSEVIGMQVMDFAAPECREQVMQKILSGDEGIYETICLCKDGTTFPAEIRARVMSYRGRTIRMAAIQDITSRKRGEEATVLAERNRLAQEIHDTLAQAFAVVIVHLDTASRKLTTNIETAQALIKAGRDLAHSGLTEARRSIKAMRSQLLEDENIFNGLNRFATQMFSPTNTRIVCQAVGKIYSLPPDVENNLLRIGQEALTNAFKYAKAQEIRIELAYWEKQFSLRIQDDGQGFDMGNVSIVNSFGLLIMSERAERIGAKLTIQSSPRQGTEVIVTVNI